MGDDEPPNKKRKKIKALPSAKQALKSKHNVSIITGNELKKEKEKQQKVEKLISNHSNNNKQNDEGEDDDDNNDYKQALKKNQVENKKYIRKQLKILHEAEKESKFKKSIQETTRQKNSRKQKLGQANFTLKWDRDCGFEMAGV